MASTLFQMLHRMPLNLVPRPYQQEAVDEAFKQWNAGIRGVLFRIFTGGGKTPTACAAMDRWLNRGADYRCMIVSYEQQLVWQFAQEIEDFMGITPGIEMASESVDHGHIPPIVVASRQTLAQKPLATQEQRDCLASYGLTDLGLCTATLAKQLIDGLQRGASVAEAVELIAEHNASVECDHGVQAVARLHKFDWRDHWLVIFDEAHKYSLRLKQTGHIVQWFEKNPNHRRAGLTATPKRFDGVSIGAKLFPGIAIDYPLVGYTGRSALSEGYAVPYVQRYIEVESVDFKQLNQIAGDYDEKQLEQILSQEETLAGMVEPMLDMVGNRQTLIFNPGVEMAKLVANYINARSECTCPCGRVGWYPKCMIGDGAKCKDCGELLGAEHVTKGGFLASFLHGGIPKQFRRETYQQHQQGKIQFLSVCGLAKEGYNDPNISCVAIFRPVSRKASSLAEQMKGRSCRPLRGLVEGVDSAEERVRLIRESAKPDALIIDLCGVTGLADCATTALIYAEGLDDEIIARAELYQLRGGVPNVDEAIQKAARDVGAEREQAKREREEAERSAREEAMRRAQADPETRYTTHDIGHGSASSIKGNASDKQVNFIKHLGMQLYGWWPSSKQASRMIGQLMAGTSVAEVAYTNGIKDDQWEPSRPSVAQLRALARCGINGQGMTPKQASDALETARGTKPAYPGQKSPATSIFAQLREGIQAAEGHGQLSVLAQQVAAAKRNGQVSEHEFADLVALGKERRKNVF